MKELLKSYKKDIWSIPNILTYLRICLIPVYMYLYICAENEKWYFAATAILILSGLTDALDGFIARRFNMVTEFGKLIDPCADKLTQFAVVLSLAFRYSNIKYLVVLVVCKELVMAAFCYVLYKKYNKKMDGAKWYGKINTIVFYMVMISLVLFYSMPLWLADTMIVLATGFTLFAFVMYLRLFIMMCKSNKIS